MPCNTFRAWFLGLIWAIIIPGLNQFFFFRYPSVNVTGLVAQLLVFPVGRAWAKFLPRVKIFGVSLNPGPFTVKEHVLITIMAGVGAYSAYATDIVAVQRVFYNQNHPFAYQWLIVMSTQMIGFAICGIARRFLVSPPSMIWPAQLVLCALFNTLHSTEYGGVGTRGGISRERFFMCKFLFLDTTSSLLMFICDYRCVRWRCCVVLVPWLSFPGSRLLQLGLLDCPGQHPPQPDVRLLARHGHVAHHIRLVADCLHWIAACHPVVGCCQRRCWFRRKLLSIQLS
jgi:OPT family oligopeptide transporter